jgi:ketosteroid isomerase-like protein
MKSSYIKSFVFLFCFAFLTGSAVAQDSQLKEKFQQKNNEMVEAMKEDNTDFLMSLYTDDAVSLPSYEPMLKGKNEMMESHRKSHEAGFKMNDMTLSTMDVWSSGDFAFEIGTYTVDMNIPGMGNNITDNGKYLTVWQKQSDDTWKIKADIWNSDNNPWADMQMTSEDEQEMD